VKSSEFKKEEAEIGFNSRLLMADGGNQLPAITHTLQALFFPGYYFRF